MKVRQKIAFLLLLLFIGMTQMGAYSSRLTDAALNQYASKRDLSDWEAMVLGVHGKKIKTPLFATPYFTRLEREVRDKKGEYRYVTDYARIALVYRSHGKNPSNIAGYDFIAKIQQFENIGNQGLNGYVWALIALYGAEEGVTAGLIQEIFTYQLPSGGFITKPVTAALLKQKKVPEPDLDLTAMAITALAPYQADETVEAAVNRALLYLSEAQTEDGAFLSNQVKNAESIGQVLIALCAAGVDVNDSLFVKNGRTVLDALEDFRLSDGRYAHEQKDGVLKADSIATRQALLALGAYRKTLLYEAGEANHRGIFEWEAVAR